MKTVKKGKNVKRVKDKAAVKMVATEGWKYCPKSEYKDLVKGCTEVAMAELNKETE
jgi:hypothetical protein